MVQNARIFVSHTLLRDTVVESLSAPLVGLPLGGATDHNGIVQRGMT